MHEEEETQRSKKKHEFGMNFTSVLQGAAAFWIWPLFWTPRDPSTMSASPSSKSSSPTSWKTCRSATLRRGCVHIPLINPSQRKACSHQTQIHQSWRITERIVISLWNLCSILKFRPKKLPFQITLLLLVVTDAENQRWT